MFNYMYNYVKLNDIAPPLFRVVQDLFGAMPVVIGGAGWTSSGFPQQFGNPFCTLLPCLRRLGSRRN
jgi:hypothetical protein